MARAQIQPLPTEVKPLNQVATEVKTNGEVKSMVEIKEVTLSVPFGELPEHARGMVHVHYNVSSRASQILRRLTQGLADSHEMIDDCHINRRNFGRAIEWLLLKFESELRKEADRSSH